MSRVWPLGAHIHHVVAQDLPFPSPPQLPNHQPFQVRPHISLPSSPLGGCETPGSPAILLCQSLPPVPYLQPQAPSPSGCFSSEYEQTEHFSSKNKSSLPQANGYLSSLPFSLPSRARCLEGWALSPPPHLPLLPAHRPCLHSYRSQSREGLHVSSSESHGCLQPLQDLSELLDS